MPGVNSKLDPVGASAHPDGAFCFEPPDPVPYDIAWEDQHRWQERLLADPTAPEAVWILQHRPCYTLGRGASLEHLHFDVARPPHPLHHIDRGGEVTHHLPGQIVVYPVLDLQRRTPDLHVHLRGLEQVLIDVLAELDLRGERQEGLTGLWLDGRKVGAIGIGCRRWITQHGLSLNVDCDLSGFNAITACGLEGREVGRLSDWIPGLTTDQVQPLIRDALARQFQLVWLQAPGS